MDTLAQELAAVCENVAVEGDWITPLREALDGVDAKEAAWKPTPDARSLWEIVQHTTAWAEWGVRFLQGQDTDVTDWPPVAQTGNAAWEQTLRTLHETLAAFRAQVAARTPEDLLERPTPEVTPSSRLRGIHSVLVHNAYHAGQITLRREQYRQANP
jgi:hypothetical protein